MFSLYCEPVGPHGLIRPPFITPLLPLRSPEKRFSTRHLRPLITSSPSAPQHCFKARLSSPSLTGLGKLTLLNSCCGMPTEGALLPCSQACPLPSLVTIISPRLSLNSVMDPHPGSLPAEKPKAKPQLREWRMLWLERGWGHFREASSQMRVARYGIPGEKEQVLVGRDSGEAWAWAMEMKCQWEAAVGAERAGKEAGRWSYNLMKSLKRTESERIQSVFPFSCGGSYR